MHNLFADLCTCLHSLVKNTYFQLVWKVLFRHHSSKKADESLIMCKNLILTFVDQSGPAAALNSSIIENTEHVLCNKKSSLFGLQWSEMY